MNKNGGMAVVDLTIETGVSRSAIYKAVNTNRLSRDKDGYFYPNHPVNARFLDEHKPKKTELSQEDSLSNGNAKSLIDAVSIALAAEIPADRIQKVKNEIYRIYKLNGGT